MEIGGYFELENLIHEEYYPNLLALNTARNCVAYLIKTKKIKKIYIPSYLCDSIYKICEREGCTYEFYDIGSDFSPLFDKGLKNDEWLYIVNYYGQITNERELKNKHGNIILDNVQAFFQQPEEGIDTLYSCRKFFGVPDGAYLATDVIIELEQDKSKERMRHILGRFEEKADNFYNSYLNNEESYHDLQVKAMSKLTHNILGAVDYEGVKKKREKNFNYLSARLQDLNQFSIKKPIGPFAYPLYIKNGLEIKRKLAKKNIYIPSLWPTATEFGGIAKEYSENILPLPCDQRYTIDDMEILVEELKTQI